MRRPFLSEKLRIEAYLNEIRVLREKIGSISTHRWISDLRKMLHMSQKQLAKRAKITQPTLSQIESGKTNVKIETLERIFNALFCEIIMLPLPFVNFEECIKSQAKAAAKQQLKRWAGTMAMEDQLPSEDFLDKKVEEVADELIRSGTTKIWDV